MATSKRKVMKKGDEDFLSSGEEDLISKLPENLLSHILSYLPTIEAVQTSLLSTKWRYLWTHINKLHFDATEFQKIKNDRAYFMDFVNRVLCLRRPVDIEKFILRFEGFQETDLPRVNVWICYALSYKVKELELFLPLEYEKMTLLKLPDHFSSCDSLVSLNLGSDFVFDIPSKTKCFPNLKVLRVAATRPDPKFLNKLFRRCPVLEDFTLYGDFQYGDRTDYSFTIAIPTLKRLKIQVISDIFDDVLENEYIIQTPNLEYLIIRDQSIAIYLIDEIPSLIKADLSVGDTIFLRDNQVPKARAQRVMRLIKGVNHAKSLILCETAVGALSLAFDNDEEADFPTFARLVRLQLGIDYIRGWKSLPYLLANSPILKTLVMEKEYPMDENDELEREVNFGWISPWPVPKCLLRHLKEITIINLWKSEDEVDLLKYLLKNGRVLEKVCIKFDKDIVMEELSERMIQRFPRGSKKCKIECFRDDY